MIIIIFLKKGKKNCHSRRKRPMNRTEESGSRSPSQNIVKKVCVVCQGVDFFENIPTSSNDSQRRLVYSI